MRACVGQALSDAVGAMAGPCGRILAASHRPRASVTFTGARHRLAVALPARQATQFAEQLGEAEFAIRGHLVADVAVVAREEQGAEAVLSVEALTIEDAPA